MYKKSIIYHNIENMTSHQLSKSFKSFKMFFFYFKEIKT